MSSRHAIKSFTSQVNLLHVLIRKHLSSNDFKINSFFKVKHHQVGGSGVLAPASSVLLGAERRAAQRRHGDPGLVPPITEDFPLWVLWLHMCELLNVCVFICTLSYVSGFHNVTHMYSVLLLSLRYDSFLV